MLAGKERTLLLTMSTVPKGNQFLLLAVELIKMRTVSCRFILLVHYTIFIGKY